MVETQTPTLQPFDAADIPDISRAGKASKVVDEFLATGLDAALVENHTKSFGISLKRYVKAAKVNVEVLGRGGKLYLKRTDTSEVPVEAEA